MVVDVVDGYSDKGLTLQNASASRTTMPSAALVAPLEAKCVAAGHGSQLRLTRGQPLGFYQ